MIDIVWKNLYTIKVVVTAIRAQLGHLESWKKFTGISAFVNWSMTSSSFRFVRNIVIFMGFFVRVPVFRCVETFYFFLD